MTNPKRAAGYRAADLVEDGATLGLGTGTTVAFVLERLAARIRQEGLRVRGLPTSRRTEEAARALGIPLVSFDDVPSLDLAIDGADEVDPRWNLIKGGGGALLREKVVASASRRTTIVVGAEKLVPRLGRFPLPVEVVRFAWRPAAKALEALGCRPELRRDPAGGAYVTDEGHGILDCRFEGIDDPAALDAAIDRIPGVVETGIFVGLVHRLVVGHGDGRVEVLDRPPGG
ncbi:MAG TPA: ribose-5-phosphate isomerase RpiA [Planctomycetota bacterium]|jgi:ribose 5-phosphate isomerase A|nr:ribose-5-phosphate isomerase RpiA [Planctomycetota bacterium]